MLIRSLVGCDWQKDGLATGSLHLSGIALGGLSHWPAGRVAVRAVGAVISLIGFAYLGGLL